MNNMNNTTPDVKDPVMVPFELPADALVLRETGYNVYRNTGEEVHGYVDQNDVYYERTEYPDGREEWFIQIIETEEEEDVVGIPPYGVGDLIFAEEPEGEVRFSSLLGLIDSIKRQ